MSASPSSLKVVKVVLESEIFDDLEQNKNLCTWPLCTAGSLRRARGCSNLIISASSVLISINSYSGPELFHQIIMSPVIQFKAGNKESQPEHIKMPKYGNIKTKEEKRSSKWKWNQLFSVWLAPLLSIQIPCQFYFHFSQEQGSPTQVCTL